MADLSIGAMKQERGTYLPHDVFRMDPK